MTIGFGAFVLMSGGVETDRLRVPQVHMQRFDLLNQQQNCFAGSTKLVALAVRKSCSPAPQLVDLGFIESSAQNPSPPLTF